MSVSTSFEAFKDDYKSEVCQSSNTTTLITMSNSRYTLQVETDDANLMYAWRVSMEARVPFTAWTVYEYYLSRSGMDQALRECRETMRRLEDTQDSQFNNLSARLTETETVLAPARSFSYALTQPLKVFAFTPFFAAKSSGLGRLRYA